MGENEHITFFTTPAYGHILCVLPVVKRLVDCGYCVDCHASPAFRQLIEQCGANYIEYTIDFSQLVLSEVTADFFALTEALITLNRKAYLEYLPVMEQEQPDLILYDSMCSFAKNIAYKTHNPSVCLVTTIGFNLPVFLFSNMFMSSIPLYMKHRKEFHLLWRGERTFRREHGLAPFKMIDLFMNCGDETVIFSPKEFQPFYRTFLRHVHFVGTTIRERVKLLHEEGVQYPEYDYYISLGSIFTEHVEQIRTLLQELESRGASALVVTGASSLKADWKHITLRERVNQIDVLPHCRYFINHGGLNSVYESIYFGIPQICLPQQEEQRYVSYVVQKRRLGIYKKTYGEGQVYEIQDYKQNSRIEEFQKLLHAYDGTGMAVDIIERTIRETRDGVKNERNSISNRSNRFSGWIFDS
ncbi:MAG: glycosyltransferase [Bacteroides sp.]|nr:glycosyltransferase [Bacteroides sp.]MCM1549192.1 glycosyltransferase [Clostridium sp.]